MKVEVFENVEPGIKEVYKNSDWLIAVKNWRESNDVENISRLEIHFKTDEQFILLAGKAVLLYADGLDDDSEVGFIELEPMKVYNVPQGLWFNNVLSKDVKLVYIEAADTCGAPDNSIYKELTPAQAESLKERIRPVLQA